MVEELMVVLEIVLLTILSPSPHLKDGSSSCSTCSIRGCLVLSNIITDESWKLLNMALARLATLSQKKEYPLS